MRKITSLILSTCIAAVVPFSLHATENKLLDNALVTQSAEAQGRYPARHPKQTLEFFGIQAGMNVGEVLPGGGWYSKILLPYLGVSGELVAVDYPLPIWENFSFGTPEFIAKRENWSETWSAKANSWGIDNSAAISAYTFATMPESLNNQLDAILLIRALHNLARYSDKHPYLNDALAASFKVLKPGGIAGVVQHQAREDRSDEWADGSNGYLKKSFVIAQMESVGFEYIGESDINANERDQAKEGDIVWRLPPSLRTDETNKDAMKAIGESNRMTLKFRKPLK